MQDDAGRDRLQGEDNYDAARRLDAEQQVFAADEGKAARQPRFS